MVDRLADLPHAEQLAHAEKTQKHTHNGSVERIAAKINSASDLYERECAEEIPD
jgi:hypothetical protein